MHYFSSLQQKKNQMHKIISFENQKRNLSMVTDLKLLSSVMALWHECCVYPWPSLTFVREWCGQKGTRVLVLRGSSTVQMGMHQVPWRQDTSQECPIDLKKNDKTQLTICLVIYTSKGVQLYLGYTSLCFVNKIKKVHFVFKTENVR